MRSLRSIRGGAPRAKLLDRESEKLYKRTNTVGIKFSDATKVVMGKPGDLRAGAVVHVKGMIVEDHRLVAEQIVILTGYVKVQ